MNEGSVAGLRTRTVVWFRHGGNQASGEIGSASLHRDNLTIPSWLLPRVCVK